MSSTTSSASGISRVSSVSSASAAVRAISFERGSTNHTGTTTTAIMTTAATGKKHVRTEPSVCWQHFTATRDAFNRIVSSSCNICSKVYKYNNSTSNMLAHLRSEHSIFKSETIENNNPNFSMIVVDGNSGLQHQYSHPSQNSSPSSQAEIGITNRTSLHHNSIAKRTKYNTQNKQRIQLMLKFLIKTDQSLSLLDNEHFRAFIGSLCEFQMPCTKTLVYNLIPNTVLDIKQRIRDELTKIQFCCTTCDCWKSPANQSYIGITCHFVNEDFQLISRTLGLVYLDGIHHTGEYIRNMLADFFQHWQIDAKVVAIVTDGGSNMKSAIRYMPHLLWVYCSAHLLNLCVHDAIDKNTHLVESISKCRSVVDSFNHSGPLSLKLVQKQKHYVDKHPEREYKFCKLYQDVSTRWNSTYTMIESVLRNQEPLLDVLHYDREVKLATKLEEADFAILKQLSIVLKPFKELTDLLGGSRYVTATSIFPAIYSLYHAILPNIVVQNEECREIRESLRARLFERFDFILDREPNELFLAMTFLDTRFKNFNFVADAARRKSMRKVAIDFVKKLHNNQTSLVQQRPSSPTLSESSESIDSMTSSRPNTRSRPAQGGAIAHSAAKSGLSLFSVMYDSNYSSALVPSPSSAALEQEIKAYSTEQTPFEDGLAFFRAMNRKFPKLTTIVKRLFCIPATSVPSECLFSRAGLIVTDLRNRLNPSNVENVLFLRDNL